MKQAIVPFLVLIFGCYAASGQQGAQRLRLAQSVYDQGRLNELPALLKDSAVLHFSKEDKVSAYKLLTLAHIYLEEPEQADASMLKLLNSDHFFEPNPAVDPAEFMGLYKTFRSRPVFNVGVKFGANSTLPLLSSIYYVADGAAGNGKYTPPLGIQVGLVFEKTPFADSKNKLLSRLTFAPELMYVNRSFNVANSNFFNGAATFKGTIKQTWLDLNLLVQLKMNKSKTLQTYVAFGPGVSYLLKASLASPSTPWVKGQGAATGPDLDTKSSYAAINPTVIGAAGFKLKFGDVYITGEGRVQYGYLNAVNPSHRTNVQAVFDYNYTPSDYKPLTLMANVGFVYPYFNPIKIKRK